MYDVCAIGDALVDFTPVSLSETGVPVVECNPGGTTANLAAGAAMLGLNTLFVGKVGDDVMGHHLEASLKEKGVDTSGMVFDKDWFTTLTFVSLVDGERSFSFSRRHGADIKLQKHEVDFEKVKSAKILYVTGMCFTDEPTRGTAFEAMRVAVESGAAVAMDVNYRPALWKTEAEFVTLMPEVIRHLDIFKGSEEEAMLITGRATVEQAARQLAAMGPKLVVISCGAKGAFYQCRDGSGHVHTYDTPRVDTTGAGDCFMSALLHGVLQRGGIERLNCGEMEALVDFANAAGATSITVRGGVHSMPCLADVQKCMREIPKLVV